MRLDVAATSETSKGQCAKGSKGLAFPFLSHCCRTLSQMSKKGLICHFEFDAEKGYWLKI